MRISENIRYHSVSRELAQLASRHARAADRASSGQRVDRPGADPISAAELSRLESARSQAEAHQKNVTLARSDAGIAESSLAEALTLLIRARELAMNGGNGTLGDNHYGVMADEVAQLRTQMISLSNARGTRGYLFAGSQTDGPAFDANGNFLGDDQPHSVRVGPSMELDVAASGAQAFTAAGGIDIFAELATLETDLRANDPAAIVAHLDSLDVVQQQLLSAQANIGLTASRLDSSDAMLETSLLSLAGRSAAVGDADPFEAYSELVAISQALEQALAVSRTLLSIGSARSPSPT